MASVNKVILVGNLGRDPDVRQLPDGGCMTTFSIATSEKTKDKSGVFREITEWHNIVFYGRLAEVCGQYLKKGSSVYIEGSLRTNKWVNQQGVPQITMQIRGSEMTMLGGRSDMQQQDPGYGGALDGDDFGAGSAQGSFQTPAPAFKKTTSLFGSKPNTSYATGSSAPVANIPVNQQMAVAGVTKTIDFDDDDIPF